MQQLTTLEQIAIAMRSLTEGELRALEMYAMELRQKLQSEIMKKIKEAVS